MSEEPSHNTPHVGYLAAWGLLGDAWVERPYVEVDAAGVIVRTCAGRPADAPTLVHDLGRRLLYPGLVNGHSHAFQRTIRGATQRRGHADPSSFWSWREAMYRAASTLSPDQIYKITRACYAEMLRGGITCVGEFHYLHHTPDGAPYDDPNELSRQVLRAGADVGIRVVLLEVYYTRAGAGCEPLPEQRRFCDRDVDRFLARVDTLRSEGHRVGLAPHSVRAVPADDLRVLGEYARAHDLVVHAHVSEQARENDECRAEHGRTPTQLFADTGCMDRPGRFTAVHAIHLADSDHPLLAAHNVCACPTTEADLGDGIIPAARHRQFGAGLSLGSDSNAVIDLVQEARLLEMHERLRAQARLCLAGPDGVGRTLLDIATLGGARALGCPELGRLSPGNPFDACAADLDHPHLADLPAGQAHDALWLSGTAAAIDRVFVGGARRR